MTKTQIMTQPPGGEEKGVGANFPSLPRSPRRGEGKGEGHKICERLNQPEAGKFPACKSFNLSAQEACQGFTCVRK